MVDRTSGTGRRSGIVKTTAFFVYTMHLWASLVTKSKKRSFSTRLLALVLLEGSISLANDDRFKDKSLIRWTVISMSFSFFQTSGALELELLCQKALLSAF